MSVFAEVLAIRPKDVEKPEPLPVGTYQATVVGFPTQEEVGKNKTPALKFKMTGFIPIDVDPAELAKVGDVSKHEMVHTVFVTDKSLHRLKKFLEDLGIEVGNKTFRECIDEVSNRQCVVHVKHTISPDKTTIYAEIAHTSKL
jgi:hypothetical protein